MIRTIGIDPGRVVGLCVLDYEGNGKGLALVMQSHKVDHAKVFASHLQQALERGPVVVAIEVPQHVHPGKMSKGRAFGIARGLIAARGQAGEFAGHARALGVRVLEVEATVWRKAIVGSATAKDARIKAAVLGRLVGAPRVTNAHSRDAAGVALWAAITVSRERRVA